MDFAANWPIRPSEGCHPPLGSAYHSGADHETEEQDVPAGLTSSPDPGTSGRARPKLPVVQPNR